MCTPKHARVYNARVVPPPLQSPRGGAVGAKKRGQFRTVPRVGTHRAAVSRVSRRLKEASVVAFARTVLLKRNRASLSSLYLIAYSSLAVEYYFKTVASITSSGTKRPLSRIQREHHGDVKECEEKGEKLDREPWIS